MTKVQPNIGRVRWRVMLTMASSKHDNNNFFFFEVSKYKIVKNLFLHKTKFSKNPLKHSIIRHVDTNITDSIKSRNLQIINFF